MPLPGLGIFMKKLLLGSVALIALGSAASAADLPVRYTKAPVVAPVSNWTGFYAFGGFGYGLMSSDQHATTNGVASVVDTRGGGDGYYGTVGLGYDYQLTPAWVVGVFGDAQWGDISGSLNDLNYGISAPLKNNASYSVGGRVGYLVAPNVLSYVNAGYSYGEFKGALFSDGATAIGNSHRNGWFIGGGVENDLNFFGIKAPGWFMKTEYRVTEYERKNNLYTNGSGDGMSFKPYVQTISTALVYRFNSHVTPGADAGTPFYTKAARSPAYNWTGFYLAGGAGYGMFSSDQHSVVAATGAATGISTHNGGRGYFGTIGGGYDWQINPTWVVGVFGDAQFGDIRGSLSDAAGGVTGRLKNDTNYAAGVRVGYLIAPNALSYVNGGYSHADFKGVALTDPLGAAVAVTDKSHRDGWFIGGGVENDLNLFGINAPGWFMKTEYRVAEYNRKTSEIYTPTGIATGDGIAFKPYVQTVQTSLVYRFNWGSPVVAKY
jgi:outer membrane immunogenic protein